jgi:hypothetical protein
VSFQPLEPTKLLEVLSDCGVDFVVIGGIAVNIHASEVRPTGDIDIMVPSNDDANREALEQALKELEAKRIGLDQGGFDQADAEYPTLMFTTRYGRLDILYRPDGSAPYRDVKKRAATRGLGGHPVSVTGRNDLIRMKVAGGRVQDLQDVAALTEGERSEQLQVSLTMKLAADADSDWATELTQSRVVMFDEDAEVWTAGGWLMVQAHHAGLTEAQIKQWAQYLAARLHGSEVLADSEVEVELTHPPKRRS